MQDLIKKLQEAHGISAEQSYAILNTIKDFIKQKFPMIEGAVDNLFPRQQSDGTTPVGDTGSTERPAPKGGSFLDKEDDLF